MSLTLTEVSYIKVCPSITRMYINIYMCVCVRVRVRVRHLRPPKLQLKILRPNRRSCTH